jgi:hypothetical protein
MRGEPEISLWKGGNLMDHESLLSSEVIQMLVSSMTDSGSGKLTELEAERFLNALARVQSGVPTGVQNPNGQK